MTLSRQRSIGCSESDFLLNSEIILFDPEMLSLFKFKKIIFKLNIYIKMNVYKLALHVYTLWFIIFYCILYMYLLPIHILLY